MAIKASSLPYADDFFIGALDINGLIDPIIQMPYGRPFRTKSLALKEAKKLINLLSDLDKKRIEDYKKPA